MRASGKGHDAEKDGNSDICADACLSEKHGAGCDAILHQAGPTRFRAGTKIENVSWLET